MARKLCTICNTRPVGSGPTVYAEDADYSTQQGFCLPCGDEGQMDIAHSNGHESISEDDCWYCHPELDLTKVEYVAKKGHTNTATHSHRSHASCTHARTPKGRAACRKAGGPKA